METLLNSNWVSLVEDTLEKGDRLVLNLFTICPISILQAALDVLIVSYFFQSRNRSPINYIT